MQRWVGGVSPHIPDIVSCTLLSHSHSSEVSGRLGLLLPKHSFNMFIFPCACRNSRLHNGSSTNVGWTTQGASKTHISYISSPITQDPRTICSGMTPAYRSAPWGWRSQWSLPSLLFWKTKSRHLWRRVRGSEFSWIWCNICGMQQTPQEQDQTLEWMLCPHPERKTVIGTFV